MPHAARAAISTWRSVSGGVDVSTAQRRASQSPCDNRPCARAVAAAAVAAAVSPGPRTTRRPARRRRRPRRRPQLRRAPARLRRIRAGRRRPAACVRVPTRDPRVVDRVPECLEHDRALGHTEAPRSSASTASSPRRSYSCASRIRVLDDLDRRLRVARGRGSPRACPRDEGLRNSHRWVRNRRRLGVARGGRRRPGRRRRARTRPRPSGPPGSRAGANRAADSANHASASSARPGQRAPRLPSEREPALRLGAPSRSTLSCPSEEGGALRRSRRPRRATFASAAANRAWRAMPSGSSPARAWIACRARSTASPARPVTVQGEHGGDADASNALVVTAPHGRRRAASAASGSPRRAREGCAPGG